MGQSSTSVDSLIHSLLLQCNLKLLCRGAKGGKLPLLVLAFSCYFRHFFLYLVTVLGILLARLIRLFFPPILFALGT